MLRSLTEIDGYAVRDINDEAVGTVNDFYFDDVAWIIRYLVVDTGLWLPGRKVLVSPLALGQPDWGRGESLPVHLSKQQIEDSPSITTDKPVSRQEEIELSAYYRWPAYWNDVTFFSAHAVGMRPETYLETRRQLAEDRARPKSAVIEQAIAREKTVDPHLRSMTEVAGYYIRATDGDIGHVEDFIVDTDTWIIRYLVIDTKNWWPGQKVLISPAWVDQIDWDESLVFVGMDREMIKNSPEFNPSALVNRVYEERLFDYYGRPKY